MKPVPSGGPDGFHRPGRVCFFIEPPSERLRGTIKAVHIDENMKVSYDILAPQGSDSLTKDVPHLAIIKVADTFAELYGDLPE